MKERSVIYADIPVGHCEQSTDGQTMVGGRSGSRDSQVRRAGDRGAGRGQEQPLRGDNRHGQAESLARHDAVRSGGHAGYHDRGRPIANLIMYISIPSVGRNTKTERVFNCSDAESRELF